MTSARSRTGGRAGSIDRADREIPEATVARLPIYLRALTTLDDHDVTTVSSEHLAGAAGVNSAKLRNRVGGQISHNIVVDKSYKTKVKVIVRNITPEARSFST